ncbi:Bifunctional DNA primase/polymerase, N-terminal [Streptomyces sp. DvalAA-14]|uniref:bifunctional DNA primase/polymerase n=1 Tax=unclassified Streptomyces TaxID=2593676 RepID=UPI00081B4261|nr:MULTISPECIES: bifunctional DNA primase/polymerase [unclassified Streptomyces]MYS24680.1 DNA primase [Streptomyces sp. SID4948]SCE48358.1 Bifunctional DNA primase/polymerase, N-terminal [Streptomyces sp. DvalAA-14]
MTHPTPSPLLSAALAAAARGWPVIPLHPGGKVPALHGERRCPRTGDCADGHRTFEQRATTDPDRIQSCWTSGPFNVGIATGPAGLLVVDLDTLKPTDEKGTPDGVETFSALCERAGKPAPVTRRIRTASGGQHLYFSVPPGIRLGNTAGTVARKVDTRAWGGQVVAPGSRTPVGPYTVLDDSPVANLPEWLQTALTAPQKPVAATIRPVATRDASRLATVVLERETAAVAMAVEGGRNAELLRAVRAVGRFVAWGDLDRATVEAAFQAGGETAGLPASECRATIRSALDYSIRTARPREAA